MSSVSIVINTLDRREFLKRTLTSLKYLRYQPFEVIVVVGPCGDDTSQMLIEWSGSIKIVNCNVANLSTSRNIGIAATSGEIVAFIDDDAIPEPEWLRQIVAGFDSPSIGAVGGKVYDHTGHKFQYEYSNADRLGNGIWQLADPCPNQCFPASFEFPYLQGTNTAFRRSVLLQVGGFDEAYAYYLDETDLCMRIMDAGFLVRQLDRAFVHHKYAPSYIRTKSVAINRSPVIKSKLYFSQRNGAAYKSPVEIEADNDGFLRGHRDDVIANVAAGNLSPESLVQFDASVREARKLANEECSRPRKLLETCLQQPTEFLCFKVISQSSTSRIVLMCEDYPPNLLGGIARFTQDKATALARLGYIVHVIARGEHFDTVDLEDGVWVHRIVPKFHMLEPKAAMLSVPQSHWNQAKSFLDEVDLIAERGPIASVEAPIWNCVGIAALLSKRYNVITSLQTTLKLSLSSRPDLTEDETAMRTFVRPIIGLERFLIQNSDGILAISHAIANEIEAGYEIKIPPEKLFVGYLGMPDWTRCGVLLSKEDPTSLNVLFVGRLEKRKGIDVLLAVIPRLAEAFPTVKFNIVGDDTLALEGGSTYREQFCARYEHLIVDGRVVFHGKVDDHSLRQHYSWCDVFVAPSRFESFGLIFLEAMMFSKPVIGCAVGGMPEIVVDEETGLLALPGDTNSLSLAIARLVESAELRKKFGEAGRRRYEEYFTDAQMAKRCAEMYDSFAENVVQPNGSMTDLSR